MPLIEYMVPLKKRGEITMKEGDKIITISGNIETIMSIEDHRIITYESIRMLCWHHPAKVFRLDGSAAFPID